MSDTQVLLIEDDLDGQEVVGRILKFHQIPYAMVGNAEDALTLLRTDDFGAVVIDFHLPGMDGWSLFHALKSDPATASVPCIAITAFHSAELAAKAIEAGFTAYFPKPLEPATFVREVGRALA